MYRHTTGRYLRDGQTGGEENRGVLGDDLSLNAQQVSGVRATGNFPWSGAWRKDR